MFWRKGDKEKIVARGLLRSPNLGVEWHDSADQMRGGVLEKVCMGRARAKFCRSCRQMLEAKASRHSGVRHASAKVYPSRVMAWGLAPASSKTPRHSKWPDMR